MSIFGYSGMISCTEAYLYTLYKHIFDSLFKNELVIELISKIFGGNKLMHQLQLSYMK